MSHALIHAELHGLLKAKSDPGRYNRLADSFVPDFRRLFRALVASVGRKLARLPFEEATSHGELLALIDRADLSGVEDATLRSLTALFAELRRRTLKLSAAEIETLRLAKAEGDLLLDTYFGYLDEAARGWAQTLSASLVVEIVDSVRASIRTIVAHGFDAGLAPKVIAREVREVIGLTSRMALVVQNLGLKLQEQGVAEAVIDRRTARYAAKLLRERALTIARTETLNAVNKTRYDSWLSAIDSGLLPTTAEVRWITAMDERTCFLCAPLNGTVVAIRQEFSITAARSEGSKEVTVSALHPPIHVRCRCALGVQV